jgi:hypothetical protein
MPALRMYWSIFSLTQYGIWDVKTNYNGVTFINLPKAIMPPLGMRLKKLAIPLMEFELLLQRGLPRRSTLGAFDFPMKMLSENSQLGVEEVSIVINDIPKSYDNHRHSIHPFPLATRRLALILFEIADANPLHKTRKMDERADC